MHKIGIFEENVVDKYEKVDNKNWLANEVYRRKHLEFGWTNSYLLLYENIIIDIDFDWELTEEQIKIVGEKLKGLEI